MAGLVVVDYYKNRDDTFFTLTYQYSVIQSDGSSFCGDVVLDSFSTVYSDEDNFKTKSVKNESFGIFIMKILNMKSYYRKCI